MATAHAHLYPSDPAKPPSPIFRQAAPHLSRKSKKSAAPPHQPPTGTNLLTSNAPLLRRTTGKITHKHLFRLASRSPETFFITSANPFYHERKSLSSRAQTLRAHPARLRTNAKYAENKLCIENVNNIRTQQSLDRKLPPTHQPSKNRKRLFCLLTSR